jgi:hypothetical protein
MFQDKIFPVKDKVPNNGIMALLASRGTRWRPLCPAKLAALRCKVQFDEKLITNLYEKKVKKVAIDG